MREEIANLVHPVFQHGLRLKDRLARGEGADLDMATELSALKGLLLSDLEAHRIPDYGGDRTSDYSTTGGRTMDGGPRSSDSYRGIRYALVWK